ncbi:MAG: sporulation protein YabP [Clostridiales bacterium]|nr:sporulation protein YabP [Clostridiales bacterium]
MPADKKTSTVRPQNIFLESRSKMSVTGVTDIDSFDENTILLYTDLGALVIHGSGLHIDRIDLDSGELTLTGEVASVAYDGSRVKGGLFTRLFR